MSRKKNVYNQVKRGAKRYKKAKAGKKGRVAVFAAVAIIQIGRASCRERV